MSLNSHAPVMLKEVVGLVAPQADELVVDGTFGNGGYSQALLEAAPCRVIAIDRDPHVQQRSRALELQFHPRFSFVPGRFSHMASLLAEKGLDAVDAIVLDIGVSSMQLDQAERGFSFQQNGPLDMRMSSEGVSAADIINSYDENAIADMLYVYGEERASRRIARAIVKARAEAPIETTSKLADLVASVLGRSEKKDPATRTFQALRIYVNDELRELEQALVASEQLLKPGGRLVVVVFHSLEDRIVKQFMREKTGKAHEVSRHRPMLANLPPPTFVSLTPKAIGASTEEIRLNPRARSAKLRACLRTAAPTPLSHPGRT